MAMNGAGRTYLEGFRDATNMRIVECPGCTEDIAIMVSEGHSFDIDCDCGTTFAHDSYTGSILTVAQALERPIV
ncbi:hypothetical protein LCGC14_2345540 [marine sediment metagenome]|uniref:Uncharacterized protein n=1 Tax=marine sediment metagenome TaxID=412755 RepID=A0A0F9ENE6_9ZZZZ